MYVCVYAHICIYIFIQTYTHLWGFPDGSVGKESACNAGDLGSIPRLGRSPGKGNGNPFQYSSLWNPMERGAWRAIVHGVARVGHDLDTKPLQPCAHIINYLITLHRNCSMTSKEFKFLNMISESFIVIGCHHYYHLCSLISWQLHPYILYMCLLDHWPFADLHARSHFGTLPQFPLCTFLPPPNPQGSSSAQLFISYFPRV